MAKRLMMVVLFVGAMGLASLAAPSTAEARGCHRGHGGFYRGGPVHSRSFYGGGYYAPRRAYYGGGGFYGGPGFYGGYGRGFYGGGSGLYIRF